MPTTPRSRQVIAFSAMISLSSNGNAAVQAEDEAGLDRVLERRPVHAPDGGRDDVVEVLLAAAVPLHRVEAELHGGDVVLAVGAADDLVDRALDRDRARLDELRPVEQLEVAVEALRAPRVDRDHVAELPVVPGRELDPLGVGDAPHDRRRHRRPEVAVELGERDLAAEGGGHVRRIAEGVVRHLAGEGPGVARARRRGLRRRVSRRLPRDDAALGVERGAAAQVAQLGAGDLVAGVVAGADERPGLDVLEAERQRLGLHLGELVGVVVALERQVLDRRPQVLADREDVAVDRAQRLERLGQLVAGLAQADHQAALGVDLVAVLRGVDLGPLEDAQRPVPAGALADRLLEPPHGLEVVVEDVRPGLHHGPERLLLAVEVRDQDLDAHERAAGPDLADGRGEGAGAAVGQVVAGDAGHHDVVEAHRADRLGDAAGLVVVEPGGPAGLDGAEAAGPGAGVAEDHDRRGALVPALPDVRAAGLLADRVEVQAAQQALEVVVVVARGHPRPDPVRVAAQGPGAVGCGRLDQPLAAAHGDRDGQGARVRVGRVGVEDGELAGHG